MIRWPTKPLGELVDFIGGGTPRRDRPDYWGGEIPWASVKDLQNQSLGTTLEHITAEGLANSASNLIPGGTVIIASRVGLGKVAVNQKPVAINQDLKALTPRDNNLLPRYLLLFLLSNAEYFEKAGVGATVKGLTIADYQNLKIPIPPLAEQERLVKLLDEADELRKLRTQANRRTADLIPALFHDIFGDAGHIAHNIRPLSEVAEVVSGVAKGRRFNGQKPVTVPYIRVANVQAGYLDLAEIKTIEALPSEVKELTLKNGDVLLTEGGDFDKLGRGALWEREIPNCIHQNHVFRVRVDYSKLLPVYFEKFLQTPVAKRYFLGCAKRTTNLASINMTQLRGLPVPVPSLTLQRDFAARVSEIRAMEFQQAASRRRLDDLFHSLLHRAFQGEV
ncbi:MAG: Type I restriction-modification system, specificity subunit S [Nitrospira sp.]|jgi:type I restriction enzyme S subunit|nr:MAG: Type I restriction-modification system, specificity subunit S [Nitrospira sp.]